jgi:hypothetical protein
VDVLDLVFPALTARGQLPHIIRCMLIDVYTTFRVDWYVFPLFRQLNGHRIVVHVAAAIVVASVRAEESQYLNATYFGVGISVTPQNDVTLWPLIN